MAAYKEVGTQASDELAGKMAVPRGVFTGKRGDGEASVVEEGDERTRSEHEVVGGVTQVFQAVD